MAPEDVLNSVDESRREFLMKVIGGTVFAVPLMASFSMEGFSLDTAEATHTSNQTLPASFCSNLTYVGPTEFAAYLFSDVTRVHARAKFQVKRDLAYEFILPSGVVFDRAEIRVGTSAGVALETIKGIIDEKTLVGLCALNSLLEEMAAGHAVALLQTTKETIEGAIEPVY